MHVLYIYIPSIKPLFFSENVHAYQIKKYIFIATLVLAIFTESFHVFVHAQFAES